MAGNAELSIGGSREGRFVEALARLVASAVVEDIAASTDVSRSKADETHAGSSADSVGPKPTKEVDDHGKSTPAIPE